MLSDIAPFKIYGNLYFVGTYAASSHLIDTGEGLILIDVGYEETAAVVEESMSILDYDVKDVKYILLSHGHGDHSDGAPLIKAKSGAKIFMFEADNKYLNSFKPDVYLKDGDIIRLGNTEILCLATPGHTEGTASFFWNVGEYRAGTFGGASANQLKKPYMDRRNVPYRMRGEFFRSVERLRKERVDIFVGNHSWQNKTKENSEILRTTGENPFIDSGKWLPFLDKCEQKLKNVIADEIKSEFVNYAHRGASEYCPENTMLSFYTGIFMGANGIETDVRRAKDGTLILFHDKTLERVTGEDGAPEDYTLEQLNRFNVSNNGLTDKIVCFEDFLKAFSHRDITFAIELKGEGVEKDTADMIKKYSIEKKCVITSFKLEYIKAVKEYAPDLRIGLLTKEVTDELIRELISIGADELCPRADLLTPELVQKWHYDGFRVRAWGVSSEELMKHTVDCGADGMTVNFPDKLNKYISK